MSTSEGCTPKRCTGGIIEQRETHPAIQGSTEVIIESVTCYFKICSYYRERDLQGPNGSRDAQFRPARRIWGEREVMSRLILNLTDDGG